MKPASCALIALVVFGSAEARAQGIISRPPTTAYGRPGYSPYGYGGYGALFPFGYGGSGIFGQNIYQGPTGPSPTAPGYAGDVPGVTGRTTLQQPVDPGSAGVTGHPTRYFYYGHYFLNQGGGTTAASSGVRAPEAAGVLVGGDYARGPGGAPPQRPARPASSGRR